MTLQEAIRIIAEYDGKQFKLYGDKLIIGTEYTVGSEYDYMWADETYSTSADALLPVYRAVGRTIDTQDQLKSMRFVQHIGGLILIGNYEQACIELATIIQQLNEKK
jgi:hypothetical protein